MKKVLALMLGCFMALVASVALADSRTDALGLTAGQQVDDLDSIWMFPQDAGSYGNVVDLRLGNPNGIPDSDWFGIVHKDFDEIGYIGIYVNRPFNDDSNYNYPNKNVANSFGILDGTSNWANAILPGSYAFNGDSAGSALWGATFSTFPYAFMGTMNNSTNDNFATPLANYDIADPQNKVDLFWSKDFSDAVIGAHFNYASQGGQDTEGLGDGTAIIAVTAPGNENAKYNADSSVLGLDLGLTLKNLAPDTSLALALGYSLGAVNYLESYSSDNSGSMREFLNDAIKDNNISEIRVNALLKNKMNDTTNGRIYANARIDNLGIKQTDRYDSNNDGTYTDVARESFNGSSTYTDTNFNLGFACDHSVADGKAKVIAGVGAILDMRKWTMTDLTNLAGSATVDQVRRGSGDSVNEDWLVIPVNVAIEAPVFGWLTARVGANYNAYNTINTKVIAHHQINAAGTGWDEVDTANNSYDMYQSINLTYGVSAKFNNLTIDMQLDPDALLTYAQGFAPGQGTLYGNSGNGAQTGSSAGQLFGTIVQADARYAF